MVIESSKVDPDFGNNMVISDELGKQVKRLVKDRSVSGILPYSQGGEIHYLAAISSIRRGTINREIKFVLTKEEELAEMYCLNNDGNVVIINLNQQFYERIKYGEMTNEDRNMLLVVIAEIDFEYRKI